jgi:hypothetical protein
MPWIALENASPEDAVSIRELLAELEHDSDRAAGIVGAVLVDESLSALIKTRFEADQDLISDMFRALGPLGSFSAEITLGFLMGLYSKAAWKELDTIRKIRNEFAHRAARSFSFQRIRDLTNHLSLSEQVELHASKFPKPGGAGTIWLGIKPPAEEPSIPVLDPIAADKLTPRQRYMRACQFFSAALAVLLQQPRSPSTTIF